MALQCGIIGLPNVGKSTIFNALTASQVPADNYPFCTIEPNVGVVPVPDGRLAALAKIYQPAKVTPAVVEFVDIAGLVRGASRGEGLGNRFLSHIREMEALIHVVRCFEDVNVAHVEGVHDPLSDVQVVATELMLKDLESVEKRLSRVEKQVKTGDKDAKDELQLLRKVQDGLQAGHMAKLLGLSGDERAQLSTLSLLTTKPVLYIANVDEAEIQSDHRASQVRDLFEFAAREGNRAIRLGGKIEEEIAALNAPERAEFMAMYNLQEAGLDKLIHAAYDLLGYETFFTGNANEVRAWMVKQGANAYDAAGIIHTDFQRGFIKAEVMKYDDLVRYGSVKALHEAGLVLLEGKSYRVIDGDVILFKFNV